MPTVQRKILFTTELGGGRGHITRLRTVATLMRQRGFRTVLAIRPDRKISGLADGLSFDEQVAAPCFPYLRNPPEALEVDGLASVLAKIGFVDSKIINEVIRQWHLVLQKHNPALVIGDFAPYARSASLGRFPFFAIGSGFSIPPTQGLVPFDLIDKGRSPIALQEHMLDQLTAVLNRQNQSRVDNFAQILRGDVTAVASVPQLDPVGDRDPQERVGPLVEFPHVERTSDGETRVYAYLHTVSEIDNEMLAKMLTAGLSVAAYSDQKTSVLPRGVARLSSPLDLTQIFSSFAAVYHPSGLGLATAGLYYGALQFLAPRHDEARMTAFKIVSLGAGKHVHSLLRKGSTFDVETLLNTSQQSMTLKRATSDLQNWIRSRDSRQALSEILNEGLNL